MTNFENTTALDITESNTENFQYFDGAQRYKDYDEMTNSESDNDEDLVSLFRAYDGSY